MTALAAAAVIPFWVTELPPAIDLPQHLAQARLLDETLMGTRPELTVTPWYFPNTLIYWVLLALWKALPPMTSGRMILSVLALMWISATLLLTLCRNRAVSNWLIATPVVFNTLFNWGLLNFLLGWPLFCLFVCAVLAQHRRHKPLLACLAGIALYYAHALWFAFANLWLAILLITSPAMRGQRIRLCVAMLPGWLLATHWYPELTVLRKSSGVETGILWGLMPIDRAGLSALRDSLLGSIHTPLETAFLFGIGVWLALILATRRDDIENKTDKPLILAASLMILGYWSLPAAYMNTIFFNSRWLPCGVTLLLLALPKPRLSIATPATISVGFAALLSAATIRAWSNWAVEAVGGFHESLLQIDSSDRVIGLNLFYNSEDIKGRPGLQLFSYAQALRGADVFFSFTEHYSGSVQFKSPPPPNPTRALVWSPATIQCKHLYGYTKIIVNGTDIMHEELVERLHLERLNNNDGTWRTYRIQYCY